MAEVVTIGPDRKAEWNHFVQSLGGATPYHRYEWLEAVETAYGHKPLVLAVQDDQGLCAVLPLVCMARPLMPGALVSLPFCDLGGPVGDARHFWLLEDQAVEMARARGCRAVEIRARDGVSSPDDIEPESLATPGQKVSMLLPLEDGGDRQMAAFRPKLRSQIRKAEKNGCRVVLGNSQTLIDDFYSVFCRNMHSLGSPVHSRGFFRALGHSYGTNAWVAVTYLDEQPVAGGIVLRNGRVAAIPWASSLAAFNRLAPNMLLYWALLEACANDGVRLFDFGRSTWGEGTFRFKRQWGAQPYRLDWTDLLAAPETPVNAGPGRVRELVAGAWRRLPLSVANAIGPVVRKHISL